MFCEQNSERIRELFENCSSKEEIYQKIMEVGKEAKGLDLADKSDDNIVKGCQSALYLKTKCHEQKIYIEVDSDALISKGLAHLIALQYSGVALDKVLTYNPPFISDLNLIELLSPSRINGLQSLLLAVKQRALTHLNREA